MIKLVPSDQKFSKILCDWLRSFFGFFGGGPHLDSRPPLQLPHSCLVLRKLKEPNNGSHGVARWLHCYLPAQRNLSYSLSPNLSVHVWSKLCSSGTIYSSWMGWYDRFKLVLTLPVSLYEQLLFPLSSSLPLFHGLCKEDWILAWLLSTVPMECLASPFLATTLVS